MDWEGIAPENCKVFGRKRKRWLLRKRGLIGWDFELSLAQDSLGRSFVKSVKTTVGFTIILMLCSPLQRFSCGISQSSLFICTLIAPVFGLAAVSNAFTASSSWNRWVTSFFISMIPLCTSRMARGQVLQYLY